MNVAELFLAVIGVWRSPASALGSGPRGPGFKSRRPDKKRALLKCSSEQCVKNVSPFLSLAQSMAQTKTLKVVRSEDFLTVEEAAKVLGIKPTAIRNYLHANRLTTFKFKTLTLLSQKEVRLWKVRRGRYGHPKA